MYLPPVPWLFLLSLYYLAAVALVTDPESSTKSLWQASKEKRRFVIDEYRNTKIAPEAENLSGQELIDYVNSHQTLWKAGMNKFNLYSDTVKYGLLGVNNIKNPWIIRRTCHQYDILIYLFRNHLMLVKIGQNVHRLGISGISLLAARLLALILTKYTFKCESSCWAVAAVEAMSDRICITSKGKKQVILSADDLLSCCKTCGFGCFGGEPMAAWKYWVLSGIVTGSDYTNHSGCRPYPFPPCEHHNNKTHYEPCKHDLYPTPKCDRQCDKNYKKPYKADKYYGEQAYNVENDVELIQKEIMTLGPVEASFEVYTDFLHYIGGIYKHVAGSVGGGHAVKILGWGIDQGVSYWLAANSWNTDWGEDVFSGYFRILRGVDECGIESGIVAGIPRKEARSKFRGINEFLGE
ncbi:cathepsin B5 [Wuchereria bancrofti]|uniref:Cathepsin B5 n=1 Tax=Wuchereria bancrofti TaxID=6293 RepID=J9F164_WUCBA|nr:cathepsin B5 [Wuchereria bancrofti]